MYALDAATGRLRWAYTTGGRVFSGPAVAGGTVYVGSTTARCARWTPPPAACRWAYTTGDAVDSGPAVAGGTVYVGSDHKVYALNAVTGHLSWAYTTRNWVDSSPAVAGGTVYVGSRDDKVYALNAGSQ